MTKVPVSGLTEAAAGLDPPARALFELWASVGLSDAAIAAMAGIPRRAVLDRKLDIVEHLSARLGLPPYEIIATIGGLQRTMQSRPEPAPPPLVLVGGSSPATEGGLAPLGPPPPLVALPPLPPLRLRRSWHLPQPRWA